MSKALTIGSGVWLAHNALSDARKIGVQSRNCANSLFYAVEQLVIVGWESEDIDRATARKQVGNHQLDRMVDLLPQACTVKSRLQSLSVLTAYATTFRYPTPSGRIPTSPPVEKVDDWMLKTEELVDIFRAHFHVDFSAEAPLAGYTGPFRETLDNDDMTP